MTVWAFNEAKMSNYALISRCGYCFLRSGKKNCKQRARIHIGFHCFMEIVRFFIINIFFIRKRKAFQLQSGKWFGQSVSIRSEWLRNPKIPKNFLSAAVFIRLNAAQFILFSAFPMRPLFKGGVCFETTFLKSLTTVAVNRF